MKNHTFVISLFLCLSTALTIQAQVEESSEYICPPCGCESDGKIFDKPGTCHSCNMTLLKKSNMSEGLNYTNITAQELCGIIDENSELVFLDVRSTGEFNQVTSKIGRFENAINIPISEVRDRIDELESYKDREIIVYCSISARSPRVSKILADNGFSEIRNLLGGLNLWNQFEKSDLPCKDRVVDLPE